MREERLRILEMLSEGKISPEEANDLLSTVEIKEVAKSSTKGRFLKVRVSEDGKEKVNVNLPLSLARFALKFVPDSARQEMLGKGIDVDSLISSITAELPMGKLVAVEDGGESVEIFIE